jgi:surface protein
MEFMFYNCSSLQSLNVSSFNTSNVENMQYMFNGCDFLDILYLSNLFKMINVNYFGNMFSDYCIEIIYEENNKNNLKFINLSPIENIKMYINNISYGYKDNIDINSGNIFIKLKFPNDINISCDEMFKDIKEIKNIEFKNFNICNSSREMFSGCSSLEIIDFSSFYTNEIVDMFRMFSGCSKLTTLNVTSFNIDKSNNIDYMFCNCNNLNIDKSFLKIKLLFVVKKKIFIL